jgi:hypothetical protein
MSERIIKPYDPLDHDIRVTIQLNFIPWTIANTLAKQDQRTLQQWLSRFLNEALEKMFQDEATKLRAEREQPSAVAK